MTSQNYSVNQYLVSNLLSLVQIKEIAIPEIQRPFVWEPDKVTELIDSLYNGYPIGYIITWQSPNVKLKDGSSSMGKKILIDGQQRITALRAAILGETVKNRDYADVRIQVAYNPIERRFATFNAAISKDPLWIKDIAPLLNGSTRQRAALNEYMAQNPSVDEDAVDIAMDDLRNIANRQIGVIELSGELDIERVTEIFIRINSKGVPLNQADFVMSTIAANETYGGNLLRKCIDHFSELAVRPGFYSTLMNNDKEFAESPYRSQIEWLRKENDDIYDPSYVDVLRVAFTSKFSRGKMADLVSLLSGRNFETRDNEDYIKEDTYGKLTEGVCAFINETNFKRFVMIIRSAGFCHSKLIRSQNTLNFAYILFLRLREKGYQPEHIEKYVRRWFVFSILRGRYSSSPESNFDYDVKQIDRYSDFGEYLAETEAAELSDAYWDFGAIQQLTTSVASSPIFNVFLASQCYQNRKGFLSTAITVRDMIEQKGDVHHIFPREYLKANGIPKSEYNQIAYGAISDYNTLTVNLEEDCCIPVDIIDMNVDNYPDFLARRRKLIAQRLKEYYFSL